MLLDPLEVLTQHAASSVGVAIGAFSVLAIATSFIGTTLGAQAARTVNLEVARNCRRWSVSASWPGVRATCKLRSRWVTVIVTPFSVHKRRSLGLTSVLCSDSRTRSCLHERAGMLP